MWMAASRFHVGGHHGAHCVVPGGNSLVTLSLVGVPKIVDRGRAFQVVVPLVVGFGGQRMSRLGAASSATTLGSPPLFVLALRASLPRLDRRSRFFVGDVFFLVARLADSRGFRPSEGTFPRLAAPAPPATPSTTPRPRVVVGLGFRRPASRRLLAEFGFVIFSGLNFRVVELDILNVGEIIHCGRARFVAGPELAQPQVKFLVVLHVVFIAAVRCPLPRFLRGPRGSLLATAASA
jgi:hypothetical protein